MGLTKIPKLAKRTWADIASETDEDSETDLQKQIQTIQNNYQSKGETNVIFLSFYFLIYQIT